MNELAFSDGIRKILDDGAERLPYRAAHRLALARGRALERFVAPVQERRAEVAASAGGSQVAAVGGPGDEFAPRSAWTRAALLAIPLVVAAVALVFIAGWSEQRRADETADLDIAVLTDDIPISVYADKGFGVFLRNSRQ